MEITFNKNGSLKEMELNISNNVFATLYCEGHYLTSSYEAAIAIYENSKANGANYLLSLKFTEVVKNNIPDLKLKMKNLSENF
ncbi:MAG: hypothetical protein NTV16_03635 [Actinobacteria bacterium]|nr:hypothetical protein [Actinomycetota bacterium]